MRNERVTYQIPKPTMLSDQEIQSQSTYKLKILRKKVCAELKKRRKTQRGGPKYGNTNRGFTPEEAKHFLQHVTHPKYWTMFSIMGFLGIRVGEACILEWDNIDWHKKEILVYAPKTDDSRTLPLIDTAISILMTWKNHCTSKKYLFPGEITEVTSVPIATKRFREARKRAGLTQIYGRSITGQPLYRLTSHSFRHAFLTQISRVSRLKVAQRLAGHKNPSTTMIYDHPSIEEQRRAVEMILDY